jgi:hypothetical protein
MTVEAILYDLIRPVHEGLLAEFGIPAGPQADAFSVAAGFQESKFRARDQGDPAVLGPATGYWQFEMNGGVAEILESARTAPIAKALCARMGIAASRDAVWRVFTTEAGDDLACSFARLLAWKDPAPLPKVSAAADVEEEAYRYYDRNWRPGAKRRADWTVSWRTAVALLEKSPVVIAPIPEPVVKTDLEVRVERLEQSMAAIRAALRAAGG